MPLITQFSNILSYYSQADVAAVWPAVLPELPEGRPRRLCRPVQPVTMRREHPFPLLLRAFPIGNGHFEVSDRESFLPFKLDPELLLSHRRSS